MPHPWRSPRAAGGAKALTETETETFLGPTLVLLSKRLEPIRNLLVSHVQGDAAQGPGCVQILFAQHVASTII
jgi:hypothetical protein